MIVRHRGIIEAGNTEGLEAGKGGEGRHHVQTVMVQLQFGAAKPKWEHGRGKH